MAVYRHTYRPYEGSLTPEWSRFLVIPRYSYRRFFESRFFLIFFVVCYLPSLAAGFLIYLRHNLTALQRLGLPPEALISIDGWFFLSLLAIQGVFAYLMTVLLGPGLVGPDLSPNALPLYFSRPFSRLEYVAGKMSVMVILLSLITWVPLAGLFFLQSALAGSGWMIGNQHLFWAVLVGAGIWVIFLATLALAVSAWIRWRPVASAALLGTFLMSVSFGNIINHIFGTRYGDLVNLNELMKIIWKPLFLGPAVSFGSGLELWMAWGSLLGICLFCILLLSLKIKAYEVAR